MHHGFVSVIFTFYILRINAEIKWCEIAHQSLSGKTIQMLPEYNLLYNQLKDKPEFLYNYAAELYYIGLYKESLEIIQECSIVLNDYEVQMLIAENYYNLRIFDSAEKHYLLASRMCPNRFMPLYGLVNIYENTKRKKEEIELVKIIIDKPVKIPSSIILKIKSEMRKKASTFHENEKH